jgi:hypothetical protein
MHGAGLCALVQTPVSWMLFCKLRHQVKEKIACRSWCFHSGAGSITALLPITCAAFVHTYCQSLANRHAAPHRLDHFARQLAHENFRSSCCCLARDPFAWHSSVWPACMCADGTCATSVTIAGGLREGRFGSMQACEGCRVCGAPGPVQAQPSGVPVCTGYGHEGPCPAALLQGTRRKWICTCTPQA